MFDLKYFVEQFVFEPFTILSNKLSRRYMGRYTSLEVDLIELENWSAKTALIMMRQQQQQQQQQQQRQQQQKQQQRTNMV